MGRLNIKEVIRHSLIDYIQTEIGLLLDSLLDVDEYEGDRYIHFGLRINENNRIDVIDEDSDSEENPWTSLTSYLGCYDSNDYEHPEYFEPVTDFKERVEEFVDNILLR